MSDRDDQLMIQASALNAEAMSRITAEIGPRALPTCKTTYMATAVAIADEVFGKTWDYHLTLDVTGAPRLFVENYRG